MPGERASVLGGGVFIRGGTAHISDSDFEANKRQGVTIFDGTLTVQRSTFIDNVEGVHCKEVANVLIEDTQFSRSSQQAIVAGDEVTVTITHPSDADVTGFMLHRSRKNGTNATGDFREMVRVARRAGQSTTLYVDDNQNIPGTSPVFLLNQTPGANAVTLRRLLPLTMFPLYATDTAARLWAQLFFCYLRVAKPQQLAMIRNVTPQYAAWKAFN